MVDGVADDLGPGRFVIAFPESVECPDQILYTFVARAGTGEFFFDPSGPYAAIYADEEVLAERFDDEDSTDWAIGEPADTAVAGVWRSRMPDETDDDVEDEEPSSDEAHVESPPMITGDATVCAVLLAALEELVALVVLPGLACVGLAMGLANGASSLISPYSHLLAPAFAHRPIAPTH